MLLCLNLLRASKMRAAPGTKGGRLVASSAGGNAERASNISDGPAGPTMFVRRTEKIACVQCSSGKRSCSGTLPCERCSRLGKDCKYADASARRLALIQATTATLPPTVSGAAAAVINSHAIVHQSPSSSATAVAPLPQPVPVVCAPVAPPKRQIGVHPTPLLLPHQVGFVDLSSSGCPIPGAASAYSR